MRKPSRRGCDQDGTPGQKGSPDHSSSLSISLMSNHGFCVFCTKEPRSTDLLFIPLYSSRSTPAPPWVAVCPEGSPHIAGGLGFRL